MAEYNWNLKIQISGILIFFGRLKWSDDQCINSATKMNICWSSDPLCNIFIPGLQHSGFHYIDTKLSQCRLLLLSQCNTKLDETLKWQRNFLTIDWLRPRMKSPRNEQYMKRFLKWQVLTWNFEHEHNMNILRINLYMILYVPTNVLASV